MPQNNVVKGQEWNTIIFSKKRDPKPEQKNTQPSHIQDEDPEPPKMTTRTQSTSLAAARINAGYKTQKTLADATRGRITSARINELENSKGVQPNGPEKQMIFKLLKYKF